MLLPTFVHGALAIVVLPSASLGEVITGELIPVVEVANVVVERLILPAASAETVSSPILFSVFRTRFVFCTISVVTVGLEDTMKKLLDVAVPIAVNVCILTPSL